MADLLNRCKMAVDLATAAGAEGVWARSGRNRSVSFTNRNGTLEKVEDATSRALSLRLFVDGKYTSVNTNDLRSEQLKSFVDEAVALTRALEPDPFRTLPDPSLFEGRPDVDLEIVDEKVKAVTREDRLAWMEEMNSRLRDAEYVINAESSVSDNHSLGAAASSNGFEGSWENTSIWLSSSITMKEEDGTLNEAGMWGGGRHRADLPDTAEIAQMALDRAHRRMGSTKGPTTRTTMIVEPSAAGRILGRLLRGASGAAVERDRSFWKGRMGTQAVSDVLTVIDDPLVKRGLGSRHFDGEGIAARPIPLIEGGVLSNLYLDTYYAKKLEMDPTTGSGSNRVIAPGDKDLAGLLAQAGSGILVTSWLGGNADGTTGDFSFGIRGHLVENGQIGAPVGEMNVTGNLLDLFSRLAAVGNDPWPYGSMKTPTLVFEDVDFAGA